jgi:hypothetical protein
MTGCEDGWGRYSHATLETLRRARSPPFPTTRDREVQARSSYVYRLVDLELDRSEIIDIWSDPDRSRRPGRAPPRRPRHMARSAEHLAASLS